MAYLYMPFWAILKFRRFGPKITVSTSQDLVLIVSPPWKVFQAVYESFLVSYRTINNGFFRMMLYQYPNRTHHLLLQCRVWLFIIKFEKVTEEILKLQSYSKCHMLSDYTTNTYLEETLIKVFLLTIEMIIFIEKSMI